MTKYRKMLQLGVAALLLVSFGCDKSTDDDQPGIVREYSAVFIGGVLDPMGNLHEYVDGTWSRIVFRDNATYTMFLDAPPWYDLSGEGPYTMAPDSGIIHVGHPISTFLGIDVIQYQPNGDTLTFVDDDFDRWIFIWDKPMPD